MWNSALDYFHKKKAAHPSSCHSMTCPRSTDTHAPASRRRRAAVTHDLCRQEDAAFLLLQNHGLPDLKIHCGSVAFRVGGERDRNLALVAHIAVEVKIVFWSRQLGPVQQQRACLRFARLHLLPVPV